MDFGGPVNLWYQTVQQGNFSFYLPKFLFSSMFRIAMVCHALGIVLYRRSYVRGNTMMNMGSSLAARLLWYKAAYQHCLLPLLRREKKPVQKSPATGTADEERCCRTAEAGKHEARGKHQRGERKDVHKLIWWCFLPLFLLIAFQALLLNSCFSRYLSTLSPMSSNLQSKVFS